MPGLAITNNLSAFIVGKRSLDQATAVITVTAAMPVVNAKARAKIAAIFCMTFLSILDKLASQIDKLAWLQSALHCSFGCSAYTFVRGCCHR